MTRDLFLTALEAEKFKGKLANRFGVQPVPSSWPPPGVLVWEEDRKEQMV